MLRLLAVIFGIAMVFAGVAGFVPSFTPSGFLFGFFQVDFVHNIVHIASGVIAIMAATRYATAKLFFQVFGVIYAVLAIAGFALGGDFSFIMMRMNMADNFLHVAIAIFALYLGFIYAKDRY